MGLEDGMRLQLEDESKTLQSQISLRPDVWAPHFLQCARWAARSASLPHLIVAGPFSARSLLKADT